jgi:hypothetical protein
MTERLRPDMGYDYGAPQTLYETVDKVMKDEFYGVFDRWIYALRVCPNHTTGPRSSKRGTRREEKNGDAVAVCDNILI